MTPLQWSLLIFGAGIVVWLVYGSWRDKRMLERSRATPEPRNRPRFGQDWDNGEAKPEAFDEFGVSRPRRRTAEGQDPPESRPVTAARPAARVAPAVAAPATAAAPAGRPTKLVAFYIAEHEGTNILGPRIHDALRSRGLKFGAKRIYHRTIHGQTIFSVASLTKPGTLDPAESAGFSTPGLSVFLQLPAPLPALMAFEDMLATARSLAGDLNAELFDTERQALLTPERERELHAQVQEWARQHTGV